MRHLNIDEFDEHNRHICTYEIVGGIIYTQQYYRPKPLPAGSRMLNSIPHIEYCIYFTEDDFKNNIRNDSFQRYTPWCSRKMYRRKWIEENPDWVYSKELNKYFNNQEELDDELKYLEEEDFSNEDYYNEHDEDDYDEDYFDAMTDGQLGSYHDFIERGGDLDDIDTWARG